MTLESYAYDGLDRLTEAISGPPASGVVAAYRYDSLSRVRVETTHGHAVGYEYDASSNLSRMTYPSLGDDGLPFTLIQGHDELDRLETLGLADAGGGGTPGSTAPAPALAKAATSKLIARYAFHGPYRLATREIGNGGATFPQLVTETSYDATRRQLSHRADQS